MEIAKNEIMVVTKVVEEKARDAHTQLTDWELAYVGGGIGDVVFG